MRPLIRELNLSREGERMKKAFQSQAMKKMIHNKKAMFGLFIVMFLILSVTLIPVFMELDPYTTDRAAGFNKPPSAEHILDGICLQDCYMAEEFLCLSELCLRLSL